MDEIGDLSLSLQTKLLRVIQERGVQRVGGTRVISLDVRIIAATNRNLLEMCAEGTFRKDLYYRLHVVPIHIPPLRQRKDDIPLLMNYFLMDNGIDITLLTPRLFDYLNGYEWAGNTRELENFCQYITSLVDVFGEDPGKIEHKGFDFLQERQESFKRLLPQSNNLGTLYQQNEDYDQDFINILQILNQAANNGETMSRNKVYESLKSHHPLSLQQIRDRLQKWQTEGLLFRVKQSRYSYYRKRKRLFIWTKIMMMEQLNPPVKHSKDYKLDLLMNLLENIFSNDFGGIRVKKIIILLFLVLAVLLTACNKKNTEEELNGFIEDFNVNVQETDFPEIQEEPTQEKKQQNELYWQSIYEVIEENREFEIKIKYDRRDRIVGYNVSIYGDSDFIHFEDENIKMGTIVAKALGLDTELFEENAHYYVGNFNFASMDLHEYEEKDYIIQITENSDNLSGQGHLIMDFTKVE